MSLGKQYPHFFRIGIFRGFNKEERNTFESLKISVKSNIGFNLEVDWKYPEKLYDLFDDLPLCSWEGTSN